MKVLLGGKTCCFVIASYTRRPAVFRVLGVPRLSDLTRHIKRVHMDSSSPRLPAGGIYECLTPPTPTVDEEAVMFPTGLAKNDLAFGESGSPLGLAAAQIFQQLPGPRLEQAVPHGQMTIGIVTQATVPVVDVIRQARRSAPAALPLPGR